MTSTASRGRQEHESDRGGAVQSLREAEGKPSAEVAFPLYEFGGFAKRAESRRNAGNWSLMGSRKRCRCTLAGIS